nr:ATP synthase F0 subunit 8 [Igerna sp.]
MPQMAPTWWLCLMIYFNITLMVSISTVYFSNNIMLKGKAPFYKKNFNWSW